MTLSVISEVLVSGGRCHDNRLCSNSLISTKSYIFFNIIISFFIFKAFSGPPWYPSIIIINTFSTVLLLCRSVWYPLCPHLLCNVIKIKNLLLLLCSFCRTCCSEAHAYTQNEGLSHSHRHHEGPPWRCVWHHCGLRGNTEHLRSKKTCTIDAR